MRELILAAIVSSIPLALSSTSLFWMAWLFHKKGLWKMKVACTCLGIGMLLSLPVAVVMPVRVIHYFHTLGDALFPGAVVSVTGGCIIAIGHILEDIKKHQKGTKSTSPSEKEKG